MPALPPIPESRELPPIPQASPPILPAAPAKNAEPPPKPNGPPVLPVAEPPARVVPELETASFFLRAIAFLIDCGVIFSPVVVLFILGILSIEVPRLFHHVSDQAISEDEAHLWINTKRMAALLAIGCGWLYAAWYESSPAQATIGKCWMRLRVVDEFGERLSFLRASGRYAAKYLSALPCFLGFIAALFSSRGLALHDRLAGTRVVRD